MNFNEPYYVLYAITALAVIVWLSALRFVLSVSRRVQSPTDFLQDDDDFVATEDQDTVRGTVEVAGRAADLAPKAAGYLAKQGAAMLGHVKILEQTDTRVAFEALPHMGGRFVARGVLDFNELPSGRTQIDYTVLIPKRQGLLRAAWIFLVLGLNVLVIGFVVMYVWVAPHPHHAIRWQTFQMLHVFHFLWPPFLLAGLYRRVQTHVRNTFETFVHNLPYLQN